MLYYESDEESNPQPNIETTKQFFETDSELLNEIHAEENREESTVEERSVTMTPNRYISRHHLVELGIGSLDRGAMTRKKVHLCLISQIEPKSTNEACEDENWINALKEELDQIDKNKRWELVPRPKDKNVIGTKWVFRNKMNEQGEVVRNKARLVCKGYSQ